MLEGGGESSGEGGGESSGEDGGEGGKSKAPAGEEMPRLIGCGWNHEVFETRGAGGGGKVGKKRVLHAEAHALADAIRRLGEPAAFAAFPRAVAWIVELKDEIAYDDAPPCRKCHGLLRAVGVRSVRHSTSHGALASLALPPAAPELLNVEMNCRPLSYACDSLGVSCERLERALAAVAAGDAHTVAKKRKV